MEENDNNWQWACWDMSPTCLACRACRDVTWRNRPSGIWTVMHIILKQCIGFVMRFHSTDKRWLGSGKRARNGRRRLIRSRHSVETKMSKLRSWRKTTTCWEMLWTGSRCVFWFGVHTLQLTVAIPSLFHSSFRHVNCQQQQTAE